MTDTRRTREIYFYLIHCLGIVVNQEGEFANNKTAKRIGKSKGELSRILDKLRKKQIKKTLTTSELFEYLKTIRKNITDACEQENEQAIKQIRPEDIIVAFLKLIELTPYEKRELGLDSEFDTVMLHQALINIISSPNSQTYKEKILNLYKSSIGFVEINTTNKLKSETEIFDLIKQTVEGSLKYISHDNFRSKIIDKIYKKVIYEYKIILAKSGASIRSNKDSYTCKYLPSSFIKQLANSIVSNQIIVEDFPIFIESISVKQLPPLPLSIGNTKSNSELNEIFENINKVVLESQHAYQVTLNFCINHTCTVLGKNTDHSNSEVSRFSVTSKGVGGLLSQITRVINLALLSDIPCLEDYFPIAHDLMIHQEVIGNNVAGPVWSHNLTKLCKKEYIVEVLENRRKVKHQGKNDNYLTIYDDYVFSDAVGRSDYCDFDFLLSAARAALYARIRAIRYAYKIPTVYIRELKERVEKNHKLQQGKSYLKNYPFSLFAMNSYLQKEIFKALEISSQKENTIFHPIFYYEACLSIIEAYLSQGLYRRAYFDLKKLSEMDKLVDLANDNSSNGYDSKKLRLFSGSILARYQLCWANYFFLIDHAYEKKIKDDKNDKFVCIPDELTLEQSEYIRRSYESINTVDNILKLRLIKYSIINEISQGIFHPHYLILAHLSFLKAKLCLFFSHYVNNLSYKSLGATNLPEESQISSHIFSNIRPFYNSIYWLEQARIYSSMDGDTELYACYSAYQSWVYIANCYLLKSNKDKHAQITSQYYLKWSKKLRDSAMLAYAEFGKTYYNQTKEKSGVDMEHFYGNLKINNIPPIVEVRDEKKQGKKENILNIDFSLLFVEENLLVSRKDKFGSIYMFGPNASYLLFSRGVYHLCSNYLEEFESQTSSPKIESWNKKNWDDKFKRAYRLFSYAWGIADDGCRVINSRNSQEYEYELERKFEPIDEVEGSEMPLEFFSEIYSIRDIYPHRITELVDLSKVFTAVCLVLRMYTINQDSQDLKKLQETINIIVKRFHDYIEDSHPMERIRDQKRFNGHLSGYLERIIEIINNELDRFNSLDKRESFDLLNLRDELLIKVFEAFMDNGRNYNYKES